MEGFPAAKLQQHFWFDGKWCNGKCYNGKVTAAFSTQSNYVEIVGRVDKPLNTDMTPDAPPDECLGTEKEVGWCLPKNIQCLSYWGIKLWGNIQNFWQNFRGNSGTTYDSVPLSPWLLWWPKNNQNIQNTKISSLKIFLNFYQFLNSLFVNLCDRGGLWALSCQHTKVVQVMKVVNVVKWWMWVIKEATSLLKRWTGSRGWRVPQSLGHMKSQQGGSNRVRTAISDPNKRA